MVRYKTSFVRLSLLCGIVLQTLLHASAAAIAQTQPSIPGNTPQHTLIPVPNPVIPPGVLELIKLEGEFADAVSKGGGRAFASWFADDGVTLNNGQSPVIGRRNIEAIALWDPKVYQLTWFPEGGQMMGPSNDTGFTYGHYDAITTGKDGKQTTQSGRYITVWKKIKGQWKVALDASANEPAKLPDLPLPGNLTVPPTPATTPR
jgi:ketosteroid isomerase-like protein